MIDPRTLVAVTGLLIAVPVSPVSAQDAIRCSNFLHNRDGTWRSFYHADLFGPNGVIHVDEGEILRPSAKTAKGEVARGLDALCAGG